MIYRATVSVRIMRVNSVIFTVSMFISIYAAFIVTATFWDVYSTNFEHNSHSEIPHQNYVLVYRFEIGLYDWLHIAMLFFKFHFQMRIVMATFPNI